MKKETIESIRIDLTGFLLENELPFSLAPKLSSFFQKSLHNYGEEALKEVTISDRLASQIAKEAICNSFREEVLKDLKENLFSLTFDASSELHGPSYLCIHVRYIKNEKLVTRFLSLTEIQGSATGEKLYGILQNVFSGSQDLLSRNLVGVSTDQGSNMFSKKDKGLTNRIMEQYPQTVGTIDLCHSFNNICKYSLKKFPKESIKLVKQICAYFGYSSLRRANFREIQKDFGEDEFFDVLNVLPYAKHRWSSLVNSTKRIICLWQNLEIYFVQYGERDFYPLMSLKNRLSLELLAILLDRINSSIKYFEIDDHEFSSIVPKLYETLILTAKFLLKEENWNSTDPQTIAERILSLPWGNNELLQKDLKDLPTFKEYFLNKYNDLRNYTVTQREDLEELLPAAQQFFIEFLNQLKDRIPYTNKILISCSAIKLQDYRPEKWNILARQFINILATNNLSELQNELGILEYNFNELNSKQSSLSQNLIGFWSNQQKSYPLISRLALGCLTLSYSTVSIERTFSILKDIRTPKRNKLCSSSSEACLFIHHEAKEKGFEVKKDMLDRYKNIWKKPPQQEKERQKDGQEVPSKEQEGQEPEEERKKKVNPNKEMGSEDFEPSHTYKNKRVAKNPLSTEEHGVSLKNIKLRSSKD